MIGKAKSVRGSVAGMEYLQEEGKGYEIDRNLLLGDTPQEIMREFRMQQLHNTTCDKNMITAVISPQIKDGGKLTDKEFVDIGREFMDKLKIDTQKQAYIMILHTEKRHKHIHIYANRIKEDGRAINDNFIGKRAQTAAHEIAKEKGLLSARDMMLERLEEEKQTRLVARNEIFKSHQEVYQNNSKSLSNYILAMEKKGHIIFPSLNSKDELQGLRIFDNNTGEDFKMSEISRKMSLNSLLKSGMKNDLEFDLKKEIRNLNKTNNVKLELNKNLKTSISVKEVNVEKSTKSVGKSILKTALKPTPRKMTKEEFIKMLKEREDFNRTMDDISFKNMQEQLSDDKLREDLRREIELSEINQDKLDKDKEKEKKEEQEKKDKGRELDLG